MNHRDLVTGLPPGFSTVGKTSTCAIAAMDDAGSAGSRGSSSAAIAQVKSCRRWKIPEQAGDQVAMIHPDLLSLGRPANNGVFGPPFRSRVARPYSPLSPFCTTPPSRCAINCWP